MFLSCNDVLYVVYYYTVNVGCCVIGIVVQSSAVHGNRQQCLVAGWLGLSVTVRVRARARARGCIFPFFFFFFFFFLSLLKVTKIFVLCISGNCDIRGIRTTTVCDVRMMYSQEQQCNVSHKKFICLSNCN